MRIGDLLWPWAALRRARVDLERAMDDARGEIELLTSRMQANDMRGAWTVAANASVEDPDDIWACWTLETRRWIRRLYVGGDPTMPLPRFPAVDEVPDVESSAFGMAGSSVIRPVTASPLLRPVTSAGHAIAAKES
jgi:hypothetical protein